jgi:hypothetical protein
MKMMNPKYNVEALTLVIDCLALLQKEMEYISNLPPELNEIIKKLIPTQLGLLMKLKLLSEEIGEEEND